MICRHFQIKRLGLLGHFTCPKAKSDGGMAKNYNVDIVADQGNAVNASSHISVPIRKSHQIRRQAKMKKNKINVI